MGFFTMNDISEYTGLAIGSVRAYRQRGELPIHDSIYKGRPYWEQKRIEDWWDARVKRKGYRQRAHQGKDITGIPGRPQSHRAGRPTDRAGTYDLYDYKGDLLLPSNKALRVPKAKLGIEVKRGLYVAFQRKCKAEQSSVTQVLSRLMEAYVFGSK